MVVGIETATVRIAGGEIWGEVMVRYFWQTSPSASIGLTGTLLGEHPGGADWHYSSPKAPAGPFRL